MAEFKLNKFKYEHIFSYVVEVDPNMFFQKLPNKQTRITGNITGGKVWGPKINGKILPMGADWSILHPHGVVDVGVGHSRGFCSTKPLFHQSAR